MVVVDWFQDILRISVISAILLPVKYEEILHKAEVLKRHPECQILAKYVLQDIEDGKFKPEQREKLLCLLRGPNSPSLGSLSQGSSEMPGVSKMA